MSKGNQLIITDAGFELLRNVSMSGLSLNASIAVTSSDAIPNPEAATTITNVKQTREYSLYPQEKRQFVLDLQMTNADVSEEYSLKTVGFYANNGVDSDVLFAIIAYGSADVIPSSDSYAVNITRRAIFTLDGTGEVVVNASFAGYVTKQQFHDTVSKLGITYLSDTPPPDMKDGDTWYQIIPDADVPPPSGSKPDPTPDIEIITEDFVGDGYVVDSPIPTGNGAKWAADSRYIENFVVGGDGVGKKLPAAQAASMLRVKLDGYQGPIVMSAKVKMPGYGTGAAAGGGTVQYGFGFGFRQDGGAQAGTDIVRLADNGQTVVGGYGLPMWEKDEWISVVARIEPDMNDLTACAVMGCFGGVFHSASSPTYERKIAYVNLSAFSNGLNGSQTAPVYAQLTVTSPATGLPVEVRDVDIYIPKDFTMQVENAGAVEVDKPIKVKFNHHVQLDTIIKNRVRVSSGGVAIAIDSIITDPLNSDHFMINFKEALKEGAYYTLELIGDVRDIAGNAILNSAIFRARQGDEVSVNVNVMDEGETKMIFPVTKWDNIRDKPDMGYAMKMITPAQMDEMITPGVYLVHNHFVPTNPMLQARTDIYMLVVDWIADSAVLDAREWKTYYQRRYLRTGMETREYYENAPPVIVIGGAPAPKYNWSPWVKA